MVINGLSQDRYKEPIIIDGSQMLDLEPINTNDTIKPTILGIEVRDFEHFPFSFEEELNISFATFKDSALAQNDKNINTTQDNNKAFKRKYVTNGHLGLNYLVLNNENQKN